MELVGPGVVYVASGVFQPAKFSGHSEIWQNACPGLVRELCFGSRPRGFRIQSQSFGESLSMASHP